jgi:hypothetical protein
MHFRHLLLYVVAVVVVVVVWSVHRLSFHWSEGRNQRMALGNFHGRWSGACLGHTQFTLSSDSGFGDCAEKALGTFE